MPTHRGKPLPRTCKFFPGKLDGARLLVREALAHKVLPSLAAVWSAAGVSPHDGVQPALFRSLLDRLREAAMLWTLFVVLMILWFLGVVSSYTLGGFIHLLLVIALIAVVLQLVQGRRVV